MAACVSCGNGLDAALDRAGHALHPTCEPLPLGPDLVASELFALISKAITSQPRSLQRRIGPSEIGIPCDRRVGYILTNTPRVNGETTVAWKPTIGTALHEMLAGIMGKANRDALAEGNAWRWHIEERVHVGTIGGTEITGSTDLFDAWTGTVVDWKTTSRNAIRESYRPHGPGQQYRIQAHLYGLGWKRAGFDVRQVMMVFLTRDGEYTDRHVWSEPFDEHLATWALDRANAIHETAHRDGVAALTPTDSHCNWCPWFRKGATQISAACPGAGETQEPTLTQLIGA